MNQLVLHLSLLVQNREDGSSTTHPAHLVCHSQHDNRESGLVELVEPLAATVT